MFTFPASFAIASTRSNSEKTRAEDLMKGAKSGLLHLKYAVNPG